MPQAAQILIASLEAAWPFARWSSHPVLIAVSGGPDSVALLHAMHTVAAERPCQLRVGHVHHGLRANADDDARFVKTLAQNLGRPFHLQEISVQHETGRRGESLEGLARKARYDALQSMARQTGSRTIVTAHTQNDQVETILFRVLRGTGIAGLSGIPSFRELAPGLTLARPLLDVTRDQILAYLQANRLDSCHDESNDNLEITRNLIRNSILPQLRDHFPWPIDVSLLNLRDSAAEYEGLVQQAAAAAASETVLARVPGIVKISPVAFARLPGIVRRALLRRLWREQGWPEQQMNRAAWHDLEWALLQLAESTSQVVDARQHGAIASQEARRSYPGGIHVSRCDDEIELAANRPTAPS